jgi:uncharacterized protein YndB with AHSA1/START domain
MNEDRATRRTVRASRVIDAAPEALYAAFVAATSPMPWLPPDRCPHRSVPRPGSRGDASWSIEQNERAPATEAAGATSHRWS